MNNLCAALISLVLLSTVLSGCLSPSDEFDSSELDSKISDLEEKQRNLDSKISDLEEKQRNLELDNINLQYQLNQGPSHEHELSSQNLDGQLMKWLFNNFSYMELQNHDLSNMLFWHYNFSSANLSDSNLSASNFWRADLSGADISGADLSNAEMGHVDLSGADLSGADLSNADMDRANLKNVKGTYLLGCDGISLNNTSFHCVGNNLIGPYANATDGYFAYDYMVGLNLTNANFERAILSHANLQDSMLINVNFKDANLLSVDFSNSDLTDSNLMNANIDQITWYNTICPDGTNSDSNGGTCENNL